MEYVAENKEYILLGFFMGMAQSIFCYLASPIGKLSKASSGLQQLKAVLTLGMVLDKSRPLDMFAKLL